MLLSIEYGIQSQFFRSRVLLASFPQRLAVTYLFQNGHDVVELSFVVEIEIRSWLGLLADDAKLVVSYFDDDSVSVAVVDGFAVLYSSFFVHEAVVDALQDAPLVRFREGGDDCTAVFPLYGDEGVGTSEEAVSA